MSEKISRREFLKKTALVGGAVVTGSTILSKSPQPDASADSSPLEQVNARDGLQKPEVESPSTSITEATETKKVQPKESETIAWLPEEVQALWPTIVGSANHFGIDPRLVAIIITEESGGKNVPNTELSGATGPMQLMPVAMEEYRNKSGDKRFRDINNPSDNIYVGCWHINNVNENYLQPSGIDLYSDFGIMSLAVGYGDGVGAFRSWQRGGMNLAGLSEQARDVSSLWTGMWHERNQSSSYTLNSKRGYNT